VAVFPVNGRTQEALFKAADTALYEAKRREADAPWVMAGICQRELPCV
jgi:predicted signal transduction protein with EAL and GGDEF domain